MSGCFTFNANVTIGLKAPVTEGEREIDEKKLRYIRAAVDNMRNTVPIKKGGEPTIPGEDRLYKLTCYTKAISDLYDRVKSGKLPQNSRQMKALILETASTIHGGQQLQLECPKGREAEVAAALDSVTEKLVNRLGKKPADKQERLAYNAETLALTEYLMRYAKVFYPESDRRTSEAIGMLFLMEQDKGDELPKYKDRKAWEKPAQDLPRVLYEHKLEIPLPTDEQKKEDAEDARKEMNKTVEQLKHEKPFQDWVGVFRERFPSLATPKAEPKPVRPRGIDKEEWAAWHVKDDKAKDHGSTTYDKENVTRTPDEIDRLRRATGKPPQELVVFNPERMAKQETIASASTHIRMRDPTDFMSERIFGKDQPFENEILPAVKKALELESSEDRAKWKNRFEKDRQLFEEYVDYVIDDHFHIVNPNAEIRELLQNARKTIEQRIAAKEYSPGLDESREVLKELVADELLRTRWRKIVREIVNGKDGKGGKIEDYLSEEHKKGKDLYLPLKGDSERIAWVTVGGPASGKTSMDNMITTEYWQITGSDDSLCQINSDHYKPLLLEKTSEMTDHGNRTWWESGLVRQMVVDRLKEMIERDRKAPDFWMSTVTPSSERMDIVGKGLAHVTVYVVACPVENPGGLDKDGKPLPGAVLRAYRRAKDSPIDDEDHNRYVATHDNLKSHKDASALLPKALETARNDLRLFDTVPRPSELIATMDSDDRELRVFDAKGFAGFARKAFIKESAQAPEEVYASISDRQVAAGIGKYLDSGMSFNFRYGKKAANPVSESIKHPKKEDEQRMTPATQATLLEAQSETFLRAKQGRAEIRDFSTFVEAFGTKMAGAMLAELGKRGTLIVHDYTGAELLRVEENGKKLYAHLERLEGRKSGETNLGDIIRDAEKTIKQEAEEEARKREMPHDRRLADAKAAQQNAAPDSTKFRDAVKNGKKPDNDKGTERT